jgi:chromosome segregation ATPase
MDIEQVIKQLDWLDEEQRKDRLRLNALEERIIAADSNISPLVKQIKDLGSEVTRLAALISRMDQFDETLRQQRIESRQYFEELERQQKKAQEESDKVRRVEIHALETSLVDLRKELDQFPEIKRSLKARVDEESRLAKLIDEVRTRLEAMRRSEDEYTRTYRLLEDGRRQDSKRLTDLSGEVAALQKRLDEQRGRVELNTNAIRKVETRLNEMSLVDTERRQAQEAFMESQMLYQAERERQWKEWQIRFDLIEAQASDLENSLQTLDATNRSVKGTQQAVEEMLLKVERRINEISEIQRLAEERYRQEWVTFRADDQKRWVNYTLTLDEQRNETNRQLERLVEQITRINDDTQVLQDLVEQISEGTEKRLQSLLTLAHEWVTTHERALGRTRT